MALIKWVEDGGKEAPKEMENILRGVEWSEVEDWLLRDERLKKLASVEVGGLIEREKERRSRQAERPCEPPEIIISKGDKEEEQEETKVDCGVRLEKDFAFKKSSFFAEELRARDEQINALK